MMYLKNEENSFSAKISMEKKIRMKYICDLQLKWCNMLVVVKIGERSKLYATV